MARPFPSTRACRKHCRITHLVSARDSVPVQLTWLACVLRQVFLCTQRQLQRHDLHGPAQVGRDEATWLALCSTTSYMSNIDGRETILASFLSSHGQPLRAVAWHLELRCGQMVLEACVGGVRGEPLRGVARGRPPVQYYYSGTACQCMCACSQRADVPAFVPRVVPHAVSAHARLEACWRGGAAPCMLSTAM